MDGEITELVLAGPEVPDFALHEEEALDGARNLFCRRLKVIFESLALQVDGPGFRGEFSPVTSDRSDGVTESLVLTSS